MDDPPARTMKAARFPEPRRAEIVEVVLPEPGAGELRVRLEGTGVCGSNLALWEGQPWFTYPTCPGSSGHEAWGIVDRVGAGVDPSWKGRRVAMVSGKAFAEFDVARVVDAVPLPQALDDRPYPGEAIGCAMNIFRRSTIEDGDTVAIVGVGFLGALLTRLAAKAGARVIAVSRRRTALDWARDLGASVTLTVDDSRETIEQVRELTGGRFCDRVIEATGQQAPLDLAAELTREGGRLVIAGYHQDGPRQVNMQLWNWRGFDVVNAHERDAGVVIQGIQAGVDAVLGGRLDPFPLFTHTFPLERLGEALDATIERPDGFMKALVLMDGAES